MGLARKRQPKHCRRECHSTLATKADVISKHSNTCKLLTVLAALKATSTSSLGACRSLDIGFPSARWNASRDPRTDLRAAFSFRADPRPSV